MIIAVDFDGTCVTHEYPYIGRDIGAVPVLKELIDNGHKLILFTMRDGKLLKQAEDWFKANGIKLLDSNHNRDQVSWTSSPKVYADIYIDDSSIGTPLKYEDGLEHGYIDWVQMRRMLVAFGLIAE